MNTHRRLTSGFLAIAIALAGFLCYAHCAFSLNPSVSKTCCHTRETQPPSDKDADKPCCAVFVAAPFTKVEAIGDSLDILQLGHQKPMDDIHPLVRAIDKHRWATLHDLSPPQIFVLTHAIHAPPAHF